MIVILYNFKLESCRDIAAMDLVQEPSCSRWNVNGNNYEIPTLGKPSFNPFLFLDVQHPLPIKQKIFYACPHRKGKPRDGSLHLNLINVLQDILITRGLQYSDFVLNCAVKSFLVLAIIENLYP